MDAKEFAPRNGMDIHEQSSWQSRVENKNAGEVKEQEKMNSPLLDLEETATWFSQWLACSIACLCLARPSLFL